MTRANPILSSFNAGELSPLVGGQPQLAQYQAGLSVCENFIPRVQGALVRRGGTRFVAEIKDSGERAWFARFVFAVNDAYVLEFGDHYIRFFHNRGVLLENSDPGAAVYEIASPYSAADLGDGKDGSFAIRYTQSGDVVYLAHPKYAPRKLIRRDAVDWALEVYDPDGGPFKDQNADETFIVRVEGGPGEEAMRPGQPVTLRTEQPLFRPGHEGALFYLQMKDGSDVKPWEVYQPVDVGDVRRSDGKYYRCTRVGEQSTYYTGTEKPIHTSGKYWDGDGKDVKDDSKGALGVEWEYIHPGYGWVRIGDVAEDGQSCTATIVSRLPLEIASDLDNDNEIDGTWRWALPAWSDQDGWPNSVAFFRDRLVWSKGQTAWFSQAGDYGNFKAKDFGEQLPSSAFQVLVQSGQGDPIEWMAPTQRLLVGTGGSVHAIGEASTASAFGPANARQEDQVMPGASGAAPVFAGSVLYAEKSGRIVNAASFSAEIEKYAATDLTVFAEHVTQSGVTAMAFQKQPHAIVWCARTDGRLVGLTFNTDQKVIGWHRQEIGGGDAFVEHVCVIPSPAVWRDGAVVAQAGARDDVWLLVRRTIDGQTRRYVEFVTPEYQHGDDQAVSGYSDCHLIYDDPDHPVTELSGLVHLEGCVVQVKANGAAHRDLTVTSGAVTLDAPAAKAVVGLPAPARAMLMPLEAGAEIGTAQAQLKRIHKATLRLVDSLGGATGPDFATLQPLEYRWPHDRMDAPPPLMTGDMTASFPGDFDGRATVAVECGQGFPFTLTAILPQLATYDV